MTTKKDQFIVQMPDTRPAREEKLKMLWEQLLSLNPTSRDLLEVIHTMESLASAAYDELLKHEPSNIDLARSLFCKDSNVIAKAGKLLLDRAPSHSHLASLVNWGDDDAAEKAWQELLRLNKQGAVEATTFRKIIKSSCHNVAGYHNKRKFRILAADLLLAQSPSQSDLLCIMEHCGEKLARKAISRFVGPKTTNTELCQVLEKVNDDYAVMRAMAILLTRAPSNDELVVIIMTARRSNCWKLREEALQRLLQNNPTVAQLGKVIAQADHEFANQSWQRFAQANPSENELVQMMRYNADGAAEQILQNNAQPGIGALREIIELASEKYKEQAARLLLENSGVSEEDLWLVHRHVNSLRDEVKKRMPLKSIAEIIQQMRMVEAMF